MNYPDEIWELLFRWLKKDREAGRMLKEKGHMELLWLAPALFENSTEAFSKLTAMKQVVLSAFVKAVDGESKALKFLLDIKCPQWAATANAVNKDEKARKWLLNNNFTRLAELSDIIRNRIEEDDEGSEFETFFRPFR